MLLPESQSVVLIAFLALSFRHLAIHHTSPVMDNIPTIILDLYRQGADSLCGLPTFVSPPDYSLPSP